MKERFEGNTGQRLLIDALTMQKMIAGDKSLAEELARFVEILEIRTGETIIHQGDADNSIFFILTGSFHIVVNGTVLARRGPNDHVGEMAAIEPSQARSATVIAAEDSLICKLTEPQLAEIGQHHGGIWRLLARELVRRLAQRSMFVPSPRQHIHLFILSSSEALPIAHEVQSTFAHDNFSVVIWSDGVFKASAYPIESLEQAVDASDFAIAIAQPDDFTTSRGHTTAVPRDNVIFELGLFIGRLGRKRTFLLEPRGDNVKLPSDLSGLITIPYRPGKPHELPSLLGPVCHDIRKIINELGPRS